jgi:hypothetical protein
MSESGAGRSGTPGTGQATMAPFDLWTEWMRANMGAMTATPRRQRSLAHDARCLDR